MKRYNLYETAFADYLRSFGKPFVPVDERRRAVFAEAKIKSFDFIVYLEDQRWIVDVKGRKFPYETVGGARYWENWVTADDLAGMAHWQKAFGDGFSAAFVFAYWLTGPPERWPAAHVHCFRGCRFAFLGVTLDQYQQFCRRRSQRWDTVSMPVGRFRELSCAV